MLSRKVVAVYVDRLVGVLDELGHLDDDDVARAARKVAKAAKKLTPTQLAQIWAVMKRRTQ